MEVIAGKLTKTSTIDSGKVWRVACFIMGCHLAFNMITHEEHFHFVILQSDNYPFITGNQPVVLNNFSNDSNNPESLNILEFYYPVSPQYSILISNERQFENHQVVSLSKESVKQRNGQISNASYAQLYSSSKKSLSAYT